MKLRAELNNLNHCAAPFLSRAADVCNMLAFKTLIERYLLTGKIGVLKHQHLKLLLAYSWFYYLL